MTKLEESPIQNNPFYRRFDDADWEMGDEGAKTIALFAIAHELAQFRATYQTNSIAMLKELKHLDSALERMVGTVNKLR